MSAGGMAPLDRIEGPQARRRARAFPTASRPGNRIGIRQFVGFVSRIEK
jgi:hypothetical protein